MKRIMIVASQDFPVPWKELQSLGIEAVHETGVPAGIPKRVVAVIAIAKMSGHVQFQHARRLSREHRLPFANATSATALVRQILEWHLPQPSEIVSGGTMAPAVKGPLTIPGFGKVEIVNEIEPEPPAPVPAEEKEEVVVAKTKWRAPDYTGTVLLLTGLPEGRVYPTCEDVLNEANLYREIIESKKKDRGEPWSRTAFVRVFSQARRDEIITGSVREGWRIVHDPKVKLTLRDGLVATPRATLPVEPPICPVTTNGFHLALPVGMLERIGAQVVRDTTGIDAEHAAKLIANGYISEDRWRAAAEKWAVGILQSNLK